MRHDVTGLKRASGTALIPIPRKTPAALMRDDFRRSEMADEPLSGVREHAHAMQMRSELEITTADNAGPHSVRGRDPHPGEIYAHAPLAM